MLSEMQIMWNNLKLHFKLIKNILTNIILINNKYNMVTKRSRKMYPGKTIIITAIFQFIVV